MRKHVNLKLSAVLLALLTLTFTNTFAKTPDYYDYTVGGRIALSSDGNMHDDDDWTASMMTMMILAKAGMQNNTVLYTHSDHIWGSENNDVEQMKLSVEGAVERFDFKFCQVIAAVDEPGEAYQAMADEMAKSTATDPLYIIAAGPMEVLGNAFEIANEANPEALNYITVISHSDFNNNHADNPRDDEDSHNGWTWDEMKALYGTKVNFNRISDQNGTGTGSEVYTTKDKFSAPDWTYWAWMGDHVDPNVQWVYTRGKSVLSKADYSDAGMAYYMFADLDGVRGDEMGDPEKLQLWIGDAPISADVDETKVWSIALDITDFTFENVGDTKQLTATVSPETALDQSVTWSSSNTAVATVDANGLVTAVAKGNTTIKATANDGGKTASCSINVGFAEAGEVTVAQDFITFEAESTLSSLGSSWIVRKAGDELYDNNNITGTIAPNGGAYIECISGPVNGSGTTGGTDMLQYKFTPKTTGYYQLTGRMAQNQNQSSGTAAWDECNDIYIKMEGDYASGNTCPISALTSWNKFWGRGLQTWGCFQKVEPSGTQYECVYSFKAGEEYTFSISARSKGVCIDYFVLAKSVNIENKVDLATNNDENMRPGADVTYVNELYKSVEFEKYTDMGGDFVDAQVDATRNVLSIADRLKWGAAETTYMGEDANVYVRLNTMLETDGESNYIVYIDGEKIAEVTNERIYGTDIADYTVSTFLLNEEKIAIKNGATIRVEFQSATNGLVAEGSTTATSRARWQSVQISTDKDPGVSTSDGLFDPDVFSFESSGWVTSLSFTIIDSEEDDTDRFGEQMLKHEPATSTKDGAKNVLVPVTSGALRDFVYNKANSYRVKMDVKIVEMGAELDFLLKHQTDAGTMMTLANTGKFVTPTDEAGDWKEIDLPINASAAEDDVDYALTQIQLMTTTSGTGTSGIILVDNIVFYEGDNATTSIESATVANTLQVMTSGNAIVVNSNDTQVVNVYTITGQLVQSVAVTEGTTTVASNLAKGIYIVNNQKVLVK